MQWKNPKNFWHLIEPKDNLTNSYVWDKLCTDSTMNKLTQWCKTSLPSHFFREVTKFWFHQAMKIGWNRQCQYENCMWSEKKLKSLWSDIYRLFFLQCLSFNINYIIAISSTWSWSNRIYQKYRVLPSTSTFRINVQLILQ